MPWKHERPEFTTVYEYHKCELRSEELYEGRSSQSAATVPQRSRLRIPYKPEFFFSLYFRNRKSCVHNCHDIPSYDNDSVNTNDSISVPRRQKTDLMVIMMLMIHGGLSIAAKKVKTRRRQHGLAYRFSHFLRFYC